MTDIVNTVAITAIQAQAIREAHMKVLVINSGSSSIKYQLFDMVEQSVLVAGILEEIGGTESRLRHRKRDKNGEFSEHIHVEHVANHHEGFQVIMDCFSGPDEGWDLTNLFGIGHRVVHGGEAFRETDPDRRWSDLKHRSNDPAGSAS